MKKIINGKQYNTDTATELGFNSNSGDWSDFSHYCETLYRKRTGEFFLHGEGGPMTKYAESTGLNQWSGGSRIMPMSWDDAQAWAEENLSTDEYESIFGEVTEDDSRENVTLSLSVATAERARRAAAQAGITLSVYIEGLIG